VPRLVRGLLIVIYVLDGRWVAGRTNKGGAAVENKVRGGHDEVYSTVCDKGKSISDRYTVY